jgi:hypothetical protein
VLYRDQIGEIRVFGIPLFSDATETHLLVASRSKSFRHGAWSRLNVTEGRRIRSRRRVAVSVIDCDYMSYVRTAYETRRTGSKTKDRGFRGYERMQKDGAAKGAGRLTCLFWAISLSRLS